MVEIAHLGLMRPPVVSLNNFSRLPTVTGSFFAQNEKSSWRQKKQPGQKFTFGQAVFDGSKCLANAKHENCEAVRMLQREVRVKPGDNHNCEAVRIA
jgi:hypothetical protein